jgi:hypothetical protein
VRNRRLSLWQSAVAHYLSEQARISEPALDTGGLNRKVRAHPMMRAANAHVVLHLHNTPLHEAAAVIQKHGTTPTMVSLSQLHFEIAEARRTGNDELLAKLESVPKRYYSNADWLGFAQCGAWYLVYYYNLPFILNPIIPLGPEQRKPYYRDWKDPKFGNGNLNYSVIPHQLPPNARIAIIGDWATGMDDAIALFDAVVAMRPDAIIHVGDIYYSGTPSECTTAFLNVVQKAYTKANVKIPIFTIPGNHEYYSGGGGYYQLLDQLSAVQPGADCQQPASYFCLRTTDGAVQLLGMDTGYNDHDPLDAIHTWTLTAPPLQPNEIAWHQDKLNNFKGITILFSHHQLFSATATLNHYWWGTPYLNDSLFSTFQPYFESIAGWIWGHEHSLAGYTNNAFGLGMGRLIGASAYEEAQTDNPYGVVYPEVPYLQGGPQLSVRDQYFNHSFAVLTLVPGQMPSITYYEFPSWGSYDPPVNPQPKQLFSETLAKPASFTKEIWSTQFDDGKSKNVVNLLPAFGRLYGSTLLNSINAVALFNLNPSTGELYDEHQITVQAGEIRFATFTDSLLFGYDNQLARWYGKTTPSWQVAVPNAAGVMNIVADSNQIYTGSNGYVTSIDPTDGKMIHQNGLSGTGYNEVRLALGAGVLFVITSNQNPAGYGIYVVALNTNDLSQQWVAMPDATPSPGDPGNLVTDGQFLYVGYRGWVYKLDPKNGNILSQNGLPGLGYAQVRLAVANNMLFVGTNGSVLALRTSDLTTQWQMNIPNGGGNLVTVLAQENQLFAGCNGLVYRMDLANGSPFMQVLNLPGMGDGAEVRLAMADGTLFAGGSSNVRGLTTR